MNRFTPYSPEVLEVLSTLIAPGGRFRISSYVDSAQLKALFDEAPDHAFRAPSIEKILRNHRQAIQEIAECYVRYRDDNLHFTPQAYSDETYSRMYLAYYSPVNVAKLQLILFELVRKKRLSGELNVIDIGVGGGSTAVAVIDFILLWNLACALYGTVCPISDLSLVGYDCHQHWLDLAKKVLDSFADALAERRIASKESNIGCTLERAEQWARKAQWHLCDVEREKPSPGEGKSLLVISNAWSEFEDAGKKNVEALMGELVQDSLIVMIEPGDNNKTTELNRWRKRFLGCHSGFTPLLPCASEYGSELPPHCDNCWNARRESLHQPRLYKEFRQQVDAIRPDSRPDHDFTNNLLSWSYVVLARENPQNRVLPLQVNRNGTQVEGETRFFSQYKKENGLLGPASFEPDSLRSGERSEGTKNCRDFFKLCPAAFEPVVGNDVDSVAIKCLPDETTSLGRARLPPSQDPPLRGRCGSRGRSPSRTRLFAKGVLLCGRYLNASPVIKFQGLDMAKASASKETFHEKVKLFC